MISYSLAALAIFLFLLPVSVLGTGYGVAGCELGSMVRGSGSGFSQVFASMTNETSRFQTF